MASSSVFSSLFPSLRLPTSCRARSSAPHAVSSSTDYVVAAAARPAPLAVASHRRELVQGAALSAQFLKTPPPAGAREVEVGTYLPPAQSNPGFVFFQATSKDTTALRAGKIVLQPIQLFRSARQRRRSALRSNSDESKPTEEKAPFGYTRKDVLLIGLGVTLFGVALKYGLELVGVDPLQAGNVVQLVIVLGMTVGWISTYMFRVANKDMTYAQQLRDYEKQVMEKRLESLSEAELQALLEQVEEDKQRLAPVSDQGITFNRKTEDQTSTN